MAESIQSLAEELARLNKNNTLWAQPQIQSQSGAAAAVTQNQPQMQDYMLQQYAYANPGGVAPAHMYADPRAANYALQQQHYLNPYQARFYGGQFNPNMPGAEYQTSSRLGIYRQGYQGPQAGGFAQPSLFGDVMTLSGYKSYAGYESPYHVQIAASRRMTERGESITNMGIMGLGLAAGMMLPGGIIPIAGTIAGEEALRATAGQYFQRRKETGEIYEVMQDLVSGSAATGLFGRGVAMRTAADMMRDMRSSAASDPLKSIEDYKSILKTGAATGLFNYEDSGGEVMGKVKQASKMVNMMMMLAEDPDIQSTVKRMADFQAMGVSMHQMERMATDIKGFATLANVSFEEVMSQGVSLGAQQAQMMGGSAAFGMRAGGLAQGMANRMLQSGYLNPMQAARRGGKSGIMQSMTSLITNQIQSTIGPRAAFLMDAEGNLDEDALQSLISGTAGDTIGKSVSRFNNMNPYMYLMNYGDVVAEAQSKLSSMDTIRLMEEDKRKWMRLTGITDENAYYYARGGDTGASALKYMMSNQNRLDVMRTERQMGIEKGAKRVAETKMAGLIHNRVLTGVNEWVNELFDSEIFSDVAEGQERAAQARSGGIYNRPREDWGGSRQFQQFLRKRAHGLRTVEDDEQDIYMKRFSKEIRTSDNPMNILEEDIDMQIIDPSVGWLKYLGGSDVTNPYIKGMIRAAKGKRGVLVDSLIGSWAHDRTTVFNKEGLIPAVEQGLKSFRRSMYEVQKDPSTKGVIQGIPTIKAIHSTLEDMILDGYLDPVALRNLKKSNPSLHRQIMVEYSQGNLPPHLQSALDMVGQGIAQAGSNVEITVLKEMKQGADVFMKGVGGQDKTILLGELVGTGLSMREIAGLLDQDVITNEGAGSKLTPRQLKLLRSYKKDATIEQLEYLDDNIVEAKKTLDYMARSSTVGDTSLVKDVTKFLTSTESIGLTEKNFDKRLKNIKEQHKLSELTIEEAEYKARVGATQGALRAIGASSTEENTKNIAKNTYSSNHYLKIIAEKDASDDVREKLKAHEEAMKKNNNSIFIGGGATRQR